MLSAYGLLYATTPEAYENSLQLFEEFAIDAKMKDWIQWWDVQKEKNFHAFTRFDAWQSNLAEVLHPGWKHCDKMGVSLLECCYFDIQDSILLAINQDNVQDGCCDGGYGPNNEELMTRKQKREEEQASQLGEDLLDFGVTSRSTNPTKEKQIEPPESCCYPPKKKKNVEEMLQRRVTTERSLQNIMKISKT